MKLYYSVAENNKQRWTRTAVECLNNHCICGRCQLLDIVYNCHMKETVLELYKKYGRPDDYIEPTIREEE